MATARNTAQSIYLNVTGRIGFWDGNTPPAGFTDSLNFSSIAITPPATSNINQLSNEEDDYGETIASVANTTAGATVSLAFSRLPHSVLSAIIGSTMSDVSISGSTQADVPMTLVQDLWLLTPALDRNLSDVIVEKITGVSAGTPQFTGTGDGVLTLDPTTPLLTGAQVGTYTVECTSEASDGGTFTVYAPNSTVLGTVAVGATFSNQIKFSIADGSVDFDLGDTFSISVSNTTDVLEEGVDYALDAKSGLIKALTTGAAGAVLVSYDVEARGGILHKAGKSKQNSISLEARATNKATGARGILRIHKASVFPSGAIDFAVAQFMSGALSGDLVTPPGYDSPYEFELG